MKLRLSIFTCALFLAFGAYAADTVPTPDGTAAVQPAATEIPAAAACASANFATPAWLGDPEICGDCSFDPCKGKETGYVCSNPGDPQRTCQPLGLCGPGGPPLCRCRPALDP